jgi:hypothetical protein
MSQNVSSSNFVSTVELLWKYVYCYGSPIFTVIGIVNCLPSFRKCMFNVENLLFIIYYFLTSVFYNENRLQYCSCFTLTFVLSYTDVLYYAYWFNCLCQFYLFFASVNRVLVTSRNPRIRQRSTHHLTDLFTGGSTLIWMLIQSHVGVRWAYAWV